MIYEAAALGAALCWAVSAMISHGPSTRLGAIAFVRLRLLIVALVLGAIVAIDGGWRTVGGGDALLLAASGLVGIFLGDWALFVAVNRLGPRLSNILFAMNAPIAAILGYLVLGETLSPFAVGGIGLVVLGVVVAVAFGRRRGTQHALEAQVGSLAAGIGFGIVAATGQAVASLIARPVMEGGVDALAASLIRIVASAAALSLVMSLRLPTTRQRNPLDRRTFAIVVCSALLAMGVGMTLVLFALEGGKVGIVSTLSSTTPVLILPLLWIGMRRAPAPGAVAGAVLVVAGTAILFLR